MWLYLLLIREGRGSVYLCVCVCCGKMGIKSAMEQVYEQRNERDVEEQQMMR